MADLGENMLGYAIYPWAKTQNRDGVIINYKYFGNNYNNSKYNLGRTLVHEVGHYLGLYHLWDNGGCDSIIDLVTDTPPQKFSYHNIPEYPQISFGVSNMFMDYINDEILLFFTKGQKQRVWACLNLYRLELFSTDVSCYDLMIPTTEIAVYPNPVRSWITLKGDRLNRDKPFIVL